MNNRKHRGLFGVHYEVQGEFIEYFSGIFRRAAYAKKVTTQVASRTRGGCCSTGPVGSTKGAERDCPGVCQS